MHFPSHMHALLDVQDEILVVLNTDVKDERSDYVTVDRNLSPPGSKMKNLLDEHVQPLVIGEIGGRSFVKVDTSPNNIVILRAR
jgi:hypothetical protein